MLTHSNRFGRCLTRRAEKNAQRRKQPVLGAHKFRVQVARSIIIWVEPEARTMASYIDPCMTTYLWLRPTNIIAKETVCFFWFFLSLVFLSSGLVVSFFSLLVFV